MTDITIRPVNASDIPAITRIYAHAVLHGTASFEIEPPDEAEMARRMQALLTNNYPYIVAESAGADRRLCLRGRLPRAAGLSLERRGFCLRRARQPSTRHRAAAVARIGRYRRSARFPADDRSDRRFGADRLDCASQRGRLSPCRRAAIDRIQARPLARQRADAARARQRRHDRAVKSFSPQPR